MQEQSILKAIAYIEENLYENINLEELANVASYSPYHFSRIFKQTTGENISTMIKRLRLANSTRDLLYKKGSITEVGLNIGYETPSSFNKAFKKSFNISPSEYKDLVTKDLENFSKELTTIPQIINLEEDINIFYERELGEYGEAAINSWLKLLSNKDIQNETISFFQKRYFGLCFDDPNITEYEKMRYEACVSLSDSERKNLNLKPIKTIPKGVYALLKFEGEFIELYDVWLRFYSWILKEKLHLDDFPPIEEYIDSPKKVLEENLSSCKINLFLKLTNN